MDVIYKTVNELIGRFNCKGKKVRLVGVKVSNFAQGEVQTILFGKKEEEKKEKMYQAIDKIKNKFGKRAIFRAGGGIF